MFINKNRRVRGTNVDYALDCHHYRVNLALIDVGYKGMELLESVCNSMQEDHLEFGIGVIFLRQLGWEEDMVNQVRGGC